MIARMPAGAPPLDGGPYRSSAVAVRRLPWVTLQWRARSGFPEAIELLGVLATGFFLCLSLQPTLVVGGLLFVAVGALLAVMKSRRASARVTVTDRYVSGAHGLFRAGVRLRLRDVRGVELVRPGADIGEQRPSDMWRLALRDRDGNLRPLTVIDDERSARWLLRGVRALIAERTA